MVNNAQNHVVDDLKIAVVGLGYVGLPLAVEFGKIQRVIGFDINKARVTELQRGHDTTFETDASELRQAKHLRFTVTPAEISDCNVFIITVPTPIDEHRRPDLGPLLSASEVVGNFLKPRDIVIYESTVYPGAIEEDCVPVLEKASGLAFNRDFYCGYSPERINPGDKQHRLPDICKITSGSTPEIAKVVDKLYSRIISAGTVPVDSIKIAEAAKVIENTQRDLNIALVNEFAIIFNKLGIDTAKVLDAAGTKWNFLPFRPGLVGGHCIGVDPYYLTHKAQAVGYHPEIILAGRRLNDAMPSYVAGRLIKSMIRNGHRIEGARVLVLGVTFKENCPDLRNSKVIDLVNELGEFGVKVDCIDPWVQVSDAEGLGLRLVSDPVDGAYDGIILAVPHREFLDGVGAHGIRNWGGPNAIFYDIKSSLAIHESDLRL